jgi:hypothetical protein
MAKFTGFACDSCGAPTPNDSKTKKIIRFEGPTLSGEYVEELCPDCTVAPAESLKPLRRRRRMTPVGSGGGAVGLLSPMEN